MEDLRGLRRGHIFASSQSKVCSSYITLSNKWAEYSEHTEYGNMDDF